jgi:hypothetical protein
MVDLPDGYKIGFDDGSKTGDFLPSVSVGSSRHRKFFVETMLDAAYRYIDKSIFARPDLDDDITLAGLVPVNEDNASDLVGDTAVAERSKDEYMPDRLLVYANLKTVLESFYQLATLLPINVQERLFSQVLSSEEGAFYYTQDSDSDIRSLHLQPDEFTPIQFSAYMENNQVKISHLFYIDIEGEEKNQYGYIFTEFPLDSEGCIELVASLIPDCSFLLTFEDSGFSANIRTGESIDNAIEYTLDYKNMNAMDGILYESVFDLKGLLQ